MRKRIVAGMIAFSLPLSGGTMARACETIAEADEIDDLSVGEIVYADLSATIRVRIKSIDIDGEEICGRANGADQCYDADELYSSEGVAGCNSDALSAGVIYLYGDPDDETGEDATDKEAENKPDNEPLTE